MAKVSRINETTKQFAKFLTKILVEPSFHLVLSHISCCFGRSHDSVMHHEATISNQFRCSVSRLPHADFIRRDLRSKPDSNRDITFTLRLKNYNHVGVVIYCGATVHYCDAVVSHTDGAVNYLLRVEAICN